MDPDSPWEDELCASHIPEAEWTKIASEFTNSGYREGITAGKEAFLQQGFDAGFAKVGVPLGQELGYLRGAVAAMRYLLCSQDQDSPELQELRSISSILSTIMFSDIAPLDLEAEQHAKEHFALGDLDSTGPVEAAAPQEKRTIEDVSKLKERVGFLCGKLGLPALAQDLGSGPPV